MKKKEQYVCNEKTTWQDCMAVLKARVAALAKERYYLSVVEECKENGAPCYRFKFLHKEDL